MRLRIAVLLNFLFFTAHAQENIPASIYDFQVVAHKGGTIDFSQFRGKKILIVNTTSRDANNRQYAQLEATYQKYKDRLVIVGFLTNDFATAPGSKKDEPTGNNVYNVTFPLAEKVLVRTDKMAPIYKWLTEKKYNKLQDTEVPADYEKFLINEKGQLVAVFTIKDVATGQKITAAIEQ
jgi:glutathione peroxidase